ncbi:MAG: hypothetical protein KC621_33885, partial [Myxococcales bacterium]|nr:hypothetical protein [Myxococcales bacterium]
MAESSIAGMAPTGRKLSGPGMEIRELSAANGLKHLAFVHDESLRSHPALGPEVQGRLAFMEQPEVGGMVRLAWHDGATGTFVYPTGTVWTVAEVVRQFAETGDAPGVKAGLELAYLVGETLVEAAEAGVAQGIPSHGNVSPWTVGIKGDGQPVVMLYGVPQTEVLAWRENPKRVLSEDSFRYAPPERLEGDRPEDVSSDLLSLALVALEMMVGRPVYDGVVADVRQQATRGEGVRRLYQWREKLPQNVREVMGRALKPDPDTRFPNGMEFVYAVHDLLGSIDVEGLSLVEVMARVRASERRARSSGTRTGALTPDELREIAADLDEVEDRPLPPPRRARPEASEDDEPAEKPRWTRVTRNPSRAEGETTGGGQQATGRQLTGRRERPPVQREEPAKSQATGTHDRPRRRLRGDGSVTGTQPRPSAQAALEDDTGARDRLRRRLRSSRTAELPARPDPLDTGQLAGLDLDAPDDVDLEPVTGRAPAPDTAEVMGAGPQPEPAPAPAPAPPPAPEPPPDTLSRRMRRERPAPPPAEDEPLLEDSTAERSAAAALLERLRTSGGRRRRRAPAPEPAPPA